MSYREVVVEVDRNSAESLSDALLELGVLSVCIEDADSETPYEQALFDESGLISGQVVWMHSRVIAMLGSKQDPTILLVAAANKAEMPMLPAFTTRNVHEQDWLKLIQTHLKPIHIGQKIWVVPTWHDAPKQDAVVLKLDPGLAFGTGRHPTTRLCMEWIEQHVQAGNSLLDYGCGSGILSILACKCGASPVVGVDIDPQAIELTQRNSKHNHVEITYKFPHECPANKFDIVVANILSNPLKLMASILASKVKPGGRLALSGILTCQVDAVVAAYASYIHLSIWCEREGWVCLAGCRPKELISITDRGQID
ncbi:50S ribosomal protein L11 methyltransferase [Candidatus Vallotia lariciata]|uniref:50S ribosomal protein L11 methyltransferase n=1 Tax=Candidatus Vallotia laricis TaxID=2018052 RepID=UPI001D013B74|nr:50S ribosomal protein L11 methyltransferase [Candidatus Vallotia lariciata]UDG82819.1 Ribosomal protein L11 methyltransferase [Candidatus Vallotia lariciata]